MVQAWVRLEAFTKARGRALLGTLADLGLRGTGLPPPPPACLEAAARALVWRAGLTVADVRLPPGLQGAPPWASGRVCQPPGRFRPTARGSTSCCAVPGRIWCAVPVDPALQAGHDCAKARSVAQPG